MCTKVSKTQDSSVIQLKEYVCSLETFTTDLVFSSRDLGLIISFTVKLSLKDYILIMLFLKFWSHMFFFLLLEAITIPAVNCTTSFMCESSVTRNALWERFKMVDNRKTVTFFSKFHLDRSSVIENCCTS